MRGLVGRFILLSALVLPIGSAFAADGPTPEQTITIRRGIMDTNQTVIDLFGGFEKSDIQMPTGMQKLASLALTRFGQVLPSLFPEGTGSDKMKNTNAKPDIWTDPAGFQAAAAAYRDGTAAMQAAVNTGDAAKIQAAATDLGKACVGCHTKFRR